jgi:hypothetical protein
MNAAGLKEWLEQKAEACRREQAALRSDMRGDEANFSAIRANIYDIFRTVLAVAEQTAGNDAERAARFFEKKLEEIPRSWRTSLEKAQAHGDVEKAHVERIKLDALEEIRCAAAAERGDAR